jgi:aldose sugar dehydrogenase
MTRHTLLALATVFVLGVSGAVPGVHSASRDDAPTLARTVVLNGLDDPWDVAFTPDGALLFTEKCRGLSVRRADGSRHFLFGRDGAAVTAPDFFCKGQSGAHGIAVDPDFARTVLSPCTCPPPSRIRRPIASCAWSWILATRR